MQHRGNKKSPVSETLPKIVVGSITHFFFSFFFAPKGYDSKGLFPKECFRNDSIDERVFNVPSIETRATSPALSHRYGCYGLHLLWVSVGGISLQATTWERPYGKHIPEILPRRVFAVRTEAAVWTMQLEELLDKWRNKVEHQQNKTKTKKLCNVKDVLIPCFFFLQINNTVNK